MFCETLFAHTMCSKHRQRVSFNSFFFIPFFQDIEERMNHQNSESELHLKENLL